jgi:C1A family cysteine protease
MEGAHFLQTNKLVSLSEQQLVDCSKSNHGCQGGSMVLAYMYAEKTGLELEAEYPYTAKNGKHCEAVKAKEVVKTTGFHEVRKSAAQMKAAITKQPVSVAIEADKTVFQHYKSGVITSKACGTKLDHGVLAVGYGTDEETGHDYFLVKNSWGATWGDKGYVKIGQENVCGILDMAAYPETD